MNSKIFIIAEAGDQHFGSVELAKEMALKAKISGADAIKYQHHLPDEEMLKNVPKSENMKEPLYDFLTKNALNIKEHSEISDYCKKINIEYLCTPFSYKASLELTECTNIKRFKIGSGEMTDIPSLLKIAALGLPMIISTGMSTYEEIDTTYNALKPHVNDLSFLYCVSEYPPSYSDMNLLNIQTMKKRYPDIVIGHSDHTPELYTSFAAAALGAQIIEKHVILDKKMPGPDQELSSDPKEFSDLIQKIRKIEKSFGKIREGPTKSEEKFKQLMRKSVASVKDIPSGTKITNSMLKGVRPGTGISIDKKSTLVGLTIKKSIKKDEFFEWGMF